MTSSNFILSLLLGVSTILTAATSSAQITIVVSPPQTIQSGIDSASAGDTVLVVAGVYNEDIDFKGKDITVRSAQGGFTGATILGTGIGPVVKFQSAETRSAVLEGFVITGGTTGGTTEYGAGIRVQGASPTIRRCHIHGNSSMGNGGGIGGYNVNVGRPTSPLIEQCLIEDNEGTVGFAGGGAIGFVGSTSSTGASVIRECVMRGNRGVTRGGAIYTAYHQDMTIEGCVFLDNRLTSAGTTGLNGGGACYFGLNSKATVVNCVFCGNEAGEGGAIKVFNTSGVQVTNSSFFDNDGGAVAAFNNVGVFNTPTDITLTNCVAWQNGTTEFVSVMQGPSQPQIQIDYTLITVGATAGAGVTFGANTIFQDPLFANPANCNLRLRRGSPCVDVGLNTAVGLPAGDLDGDTRVLNGTVDLGADELDSRGAVLFHDRGPISVAAPGTITFQVETDAGYSGDPCAFVPSFSGTWPGFDLGNVHVPLNLDALSDLYFLQSIGATGSSSIVIPLSGVIGASAIGLEVHFAAVMGGSPFVVSNAVGVRFVQ